MMPIVVH